MGRGDEIFVGTVFLTGDDTDDELIIGIETDSYELLIEEGELYDDLRELEGERIVAKGAMWIEETGDRWLDLRSFDLVDGD